MTKQYQRELRALLSPAEQKVFSKLSTPLKIQEFLDELPINFEPLGEDTIYSPRRVLREKKAHCVEGALFAAAALAYHGRPPLLLDIQTKACDEDHVLAMFKQEGHWGAISKTNHGILRWRDPVYKTVRELAMSYFHEYIVADGEKTMLAYSRPFDLSRYDPHWVVAELDLVQLICDLDDSPHVPVAPKRLLRTVRRAQPIETKILNVTEWLPSGKKRSW